MNQVSWRRILERAGDDGPGENGAAIIDLQERAQGRLQRRPQQHETQPPPPSPEDYGVASGDLEAELSRALDRAESRGRERSAAQAPPPTPRRREPVYPPEANPPRQRRPQHMRSAPALRPDRVAPVAPPLPHPPQKSGTGARNLLAISLSAAVIGFAFYQLGNQWSETNGGGAQPSSSAANQADPSLSSALMTGAEQVPLPEPRNPARTEFQGNRIDLRPSLATGGETAEADTAAQTSLLDEDIQEAARLLASAEQERRTAERQAQQQAATVSPEQRIANLQAGTEQTMLQRGNDMVAQGRIESARLIFEHLAGQNSALGAFALAQSYDPGFLNEQGIDPALADPELAAKWYEHAARLTGTISGG